MSRRSHNPRRRFPVDIPLDAANAIDAICDRFESGWKSGVRPTIDQFLSETPEAHRAYLFGELVRIDLEYRARHGEPASTDEYLSRYPTFSAVLSSLRAEVAHEETITVRHKTTRVASRYELFAEVGVGGFGVVWRAWDAHLKRFVALKRPKMIFTTPDQAKAFLREARAASELDHKYIVPVLDMGTTDDGTPYLVSRLVDGVSLRSWFKKNRQPPEGIAQILSALCDAMDHARVKGVVHRDLKPSNVLIDARGEPHITDFGLAVRAEDGGTLEPSGTVAGTPAYMSPEQVRGRPRADHRSDVYALGATLHELLTGQPPFEGTQAEILQKVLNEEPAAPRSLNPDIPVDLQTICQKAMAKDRADRYQTAGAMADDLRRFLNGEPILGKPLGPLERAWRWSRKNRALAAAITAAVFAVCTSIALGVAVQSRPAAAATDENRPVEITTEPDGARIVFWKLDDRTGEPTPGDEASRFEAPTLSPVKGKRFALPPGEYFVVAALSDGRFHEVYRHVPPWDEVLPYGPTQRHWSKSKVDPKIAVLPKIAIPESNAAATKGMALIAGKNHFAMGKPDSTIVPRHFRDVASFHIDPFEHPVRDRRKKPGQRLTIHNNYVEPPDDDHAFCMPYDSLLMYAEVEGKRIPTEVELEFAATNGGRTRFPWGDAPPTPEQIEQDGVKAVGTPSWDMLPTDPPVYGLVSNVAEWTTTWASLYPPMAHIEAIPRSQAFQQRVVRGVLRPPEDADKPRQESDYDPRARRFVYRYQMNKGLGARYVRSARPHLTADDFRGPVD